MKVTKEKILALDHYLPKRCLLELESIRALVRNPERPIWLGVRGTAQRRLSRFEDAKASLSMALKLARRQENPRKDLGDLLLRSGNVVGAEGDFALAYGLAREAAQEFIASGAKEGIGRALVDQGQWLNHLGRIQESEESFLAAKFFLTPSQHDQLYAVNQGLAVIAYQKSELKESLKYLNAAIEEASKAKSRDQLKINWIKAWLYEEMGEVTRALQLFEDLFETYKAAENVVESALSGLEVCRVIAQAGRDTSHWIGRVCGLVYINCEIPQVFENVLVELFVKQGEVNLDDIKDAICKIRGTPQGSNSPCKLTRSIDFDISNMSQERQDFRFLEHISAKECLRRLQLIYPKGIDVPIWLGIQGSALRRLSQIDAAWHSLSRALKVARKLEIPKSDLGDLLLRSATIAGANFDFSLALGLCKEAAIELCICGPSEVGRSLVDQAQWLHHLGHRILSEQTFRTAGKFLNATQYDHLFALHTGLSIIEYEKGNLNSSLQLVQQAKVNARKANSRDQLKVLWLEAGVLKELGDNEASFRIFMSLFEQYEHEGNLVESALAGLEACRLKAQGNDTETVISIVCGLLSRHKEVPKAVKIVLLDLYSIREKASLEEITMAISSLRRAPEGMLAPMGFNR